MNDINTDEFLIVSALDDRTHNYCIIIKVSDTVVLVTAVSCLKSPILTDADAHPCRVKQRVRHSTSQRTRNCPSQESNYIISKNILLLSRVATFRCIVVGTISVGIFVPSSN